VIRVLGQESASELGSLAPAEADANDSEDDEADAEAVADASLAAGAGGGKASQSTSKESRMCCAAFRSASLGRMMSITTTHPRPSGAAVTTKEIGTFTLHARHSCIFTE
jgi:hypothetical protein